MNKYMAGRTTVRRDVMWKNISELLGGEGMMNTCSSPEETRGFEEPSVGQSLWEEH